MKEIQSLTDSYGAPQMQVQEKSLQALESGELNCRSSHSTRN